MDKKPARSYVIPFLLLILAYEWLISSINKLVTKNYYSNLHQQLTQSLSGIQVHPYAYLVKTIGLEHYHVIGTLVVLGEVFVGVTFLILAFRKLQGKVSRMEGWFGVIVSILAAFMSLNYALLGGDTLFVDPANAFQEGISIDWVLFFEEVTLAFHFYLLAIHKSKVQETTAQRNAVEKISLSSN
jgi:thiosulfate dehydrogenase [quinone] large subunit